jgi:hypothetical protein
MTYGDKASRQREYRAWVRSHHPDAGGDPGEFATGLARWRERPAGDEGGEGGAPPRETSVFRARGLWLARRWWQRRQRPPRTR